MLHTTRISSQYSSIFSMFPKTRICRISNTFPKPINPGSASASPLGAQAHPPSPPWGRKRTPLPTDQPEQPLSARPAPTPCSARVPSLSAPGCCGTTPPLHECRHCGGQSCSLSWTPHLNGIQSPPNSVHRGGGRTPTSVYRISGLPPLAGRTQWSNGRVNSCWSNLRLGGCVQAELSTLYGVYPRWLVEHIGVNWNQLGFRRLPVLVFCVVATPSPQPPMPSWRPLPATPEVYRSPRPVVEDLPGQVWRRLSTHTNIARP